MKKTRKVFAGFTACMCLTGLLSAVPVTVQAEVIPFTCRVSLIKYDADNQPESYIVTENRFFNYAISAEEMQTYLAEGSTLPVVGDVLYIMSPCRENISSYGEFVFEEDSTITNQGNELEFFKDTQDFVVTKHFEDTGGICWTRLTDTTTGDYWIYKDYDYLYDSVYSLKNVSIGDTVTCAIKTGNNYSYPMQVLSVKKGDGTMPALETKTSDYAQNIIFIGEKTQEGHNIPDQYAVTSDGIWSEWALSNFMYIFGATDTDDMPQYGDVYSGDYMIYETYPGQFEPNYLKKLGTVEDFYPIKEMTVSENQSGDYPEMLLTDADGKEYKYSYEMYHYVNWKFDTPIQNLKAGDTVKCAFTEDRILLITDIVNSNPVVSEVLATGDADGNGKLDILDVITVNKVVMGKEILDKDRIAYIDFNQNGTADADDSLTMIKKLVGLE